MKAPAFYSEDMKELLSTHYVDEEIFVEAGLIKEAEEEPLTAEQKAKLAEIGTMFDDIFLEAYGGDRDFLDFMKSSSIRLLEEQIATYRTASHDIGLAYDSKSDMLQYDGKPDREWILKALTVLSQKMRESFDLAMKHLSEAITKIKNLPPPKKT